MLSCLPPSEVVTEEETLQLNRRSGALLAMLAALVLMLVLTPARADEFVLKLHTWVDEASADYRDTLLPWMQQVEKASDGRIRFDPYPAMGLGGKPAELIDQVRTGKADIVWTRPGFSGKQFERLEAFELPFILTDPEAVSRAYWEYAQAYAADALTGMHLLALHVGGAAVIHTRGRAVPNMAALKNLRVSAPTRQSAKLLSALGARPVMLPGPGTRSALIERTIDGVLAPWDVAADDGLNDKTFYHTVFDPRALNASTHMLAVNAKLFQSLPDDLKKALSGAGGLETSAQFGRRYKLRHQQLQASLRADRIVTVPAEEAEAFRKAAASVEAQWVKKITADGFDGQKLLDGARTLIRQHTN